jgi:hypothetical protein
MLWLIHLGKTPFVRFALTTLLRAFSVRLELFLGNIRKLVCIISLTQNHILFIIGGCEKSLILLLQERL